MVDVLVVVNGDTSNNDTVSYDTKLTFDITIPRRSNLYFFHQSVRCGICHKVFDTLAYKFFTGSYPSDIHAATQRLTMYF